MHSVLHVLLREAQSAWDTAVPLVGPCTQPLDSGFNSWLHLLGLLWPSHCSSSPPRTLQEATFGLRLAFGPLGSIYNGEGSACG